eukprot:scaffold2957_cov350-Prasinococcus_capsulatus_cf.AAC.1
MRRRRYHIDAQAYAPSIRKSDPIDTQGRGPRPESRRYTLTLAFGGPRRTGRNGIYESFFVSVSSIPLLCAAATAPAPPPGNCPGGRLDGMCGGVGPYACELEPL